MTSTANSTGLPTRPGRSSHEKYNANAMVLSTASRVARSRWARPGSVASHAGVESTVNGCVNLHRSSHTHVGAIEHVDDVELAVEHGELVAEAR